MTTFTRTDSGNPAFHELIALLDADLREWDGEDHSFYAQYNMIESIHHVIICFVDGSAIGCGAIKKYDALLAEIKRMFVRPEYRGHGIGLAILKELEIWAAELNFSACILETGKKQTSAISLYKKAGYSVTNNYGQYENIEYSVCMRKPIL